MIIQKQSQYFCDLDSNKYKKVCGDWVKIKEESQLWYTLHTHHRWPTCNCSSFNPNSSTCNMIHSQGAGQICVDKKLSSQKRNGLMPNLMYLLLLPTLIDSEFIIPRSQPFRPETTPKFKSIKTKLSNHLTLKKTLQDKIV